LQACTIIARNYLPYARVLARSLRAVHPDCRLTTLVIDGEAEPSDQDLFRALTLDAVAPDADERERLAFIYDVTELSTATKPLLLRRLLQESKGPVLYFDPDMEIFDSVEGLWETAAAHGIALTPHTLAPIPDDGLGASDTFVLQAGVYNLGFIGVGPSSEDFLDWWWGRLRRHCISEPGHGIFVDQRWVDYVPSFFSHTIVRDPGCNVAYWNLHHRVISRRAGRFEVNGQALRFFHFSGYDPANPHLLSKHQGTNPRILLSERPDVRELCDAYGRKLRECGHTPIPASYRYAKLSNGMPIDRVARRLYRQGLIDAERTGRPRPPLPSDPNALIDWLNSPSEEAPRISRYLHAVRQTRMDLVVAFPQIHGSAAQGYLDWARLDQWAAMTIPVALRPPAPTSDPLASPFRTSSREGINVVGYLRAELGVGEVARLLLTAAAAHGIPSTAIVNQGTVSRQEDPFATGATHVADEPYGVTLVCSNADELPRVVDSLPRKFVEGRYRIGFWFWETEELPSWIAAPCAGFVDEIWTASEYVAAAVRKAVAKPVHVCPLPVRVPNPTPGLSRAHFGLPDGFLFLFSFDLLSTVRRKNPIGLVEAFCQAFSPGEGPILVLKCINGHLVRAGLEAIREAARGRADIVILDQYLARAESDALTNLCDGYVSLHRSEGFGLTILEAMALGKPVIATAYSGNMTFMTPENSLLVPWKPTTIAAGCPPYPEGHQWAEPDLKAAASLMRGVYENPGLARERGERARRDVLERCSPARTAAFLRERLEEVSRIARERDATARHAADAERLAREAAQQAALETAAREAALEAERRAQEEAKSRALTVALEEAAETGRMLVEGVRHEAPSRFGWPGRVLRTAVMRILRPYSQFERRVHDHHLRSTVQLLAALQAGDRKDVEVSESRPRP
jgi:glycosyltransferase involved in cell wall biosynthesis